MFEEADPNGMDIYDLPDKESKRTIIKMFTEVR
jgi:hypothetical protein